MIQINNITAVHLYSPAVRETVILAKAGDPAATEKIARELSELLPDDCCLVPVPSHNGQPTHTGTICLKIKFDFKKWKPEYCPCISGRKRESQYVTKKAGGLLSGSDFGFQKEEAELNKPIYIIEDVVGTGETIRAMRQLLPDAKVVCYAIDLKSYKQNNLP